MAFNWSPTLIANQQTSKSLYKFCQKRVNDDYVIKYPFWELIWKPQLGPKPGQAKPDFGFWLVIRVPVNDWEYM